MIDEIPTDGLRVLVLGVGGPDGQGLMEHLSRTFPGVVLHTADHRAAPADDSLPTVAPRGRRHRLPKGSDPRFIPRLVELCRAHFIDVVLPTSDAQLEPLAAARVRLSGGGTRVAVSPAHSIRKCRDRQSLHRSLSGMVHTVATTPWNGTHDPARLPYPAIAWPRKYGQEASVTIAYGPADLGNVPVDGSYVVSEYLPGPEYTVDVFRARNDHILAAIPQFHPLARPDTVASSRTLHDAELSRNAIAAVEELGLYGAVQIRFRTREDGQAVVVEVTPRLTTSVALVAAAGIDLVELTLLDTIGAPLMGCMRSFGDISIQHEPDPGAPGRSGERLAVAC